MISEEFKAMTSTPSVIRELSVYATERGKQIGYENVFDYSLGNPSVPVPEELTKAMIELLQTVIVQILEIPRQDRQLLIL